MPLFWNSVQQNDDSTKPLTIGNWVCYCDGRLLRAQRFRMNFIATMRHTASPQTYRFLGFKEVRSSRNLALPYLV
jgi:hypothetical protein